MAPHDDLTPVTRASASLSRRRILVGAAWATPAIMVGVAAPQAAASPGVTPAGGVPAPLPAGTGVVNAPNSGQATAGYQANRWHSTSSSTIKAVVVSDYIQNVGNGAPSTTGLTLTVTAPTLGASSLDWGIGGNASGVPNGTPWMVASATENGGTATVVLVYTGAPLGAWNGVSISNLWFRTGMDPRPSSVTLRVDATYSTGQTSSHTTVVSVA